MKEAKDWKYGDILHLSRPVSGRHAPMPLSDRAAQFSPFAALTGYEAVIDEAGRLTQSSAELSEDGAAMVDEQLRLIGENMDRHPVVSVTWFQPDDRKSGGAYVTTAGPAAKIDLYRGYLVLESGEHIPLQRIRRITMEG